MWLFFFRNKADSPCPFKNTAFCHCSGPVGSDRRGRHQRSHAPLWCEQKQLGLSRLNHWLPRNQAHPEVVQGTAEFHDQIADARLPQSETVLHDATALDTAVDVLDAQPTLVERLVSSLLLPRELLAAGFLGRHEDHHVRECERQKAQIL